MEPGLAGQIRAWSPVRELLPRSPEGDLSSPPHAAGEPRPSPPVLPPVLTACLDGVSRRRVLTACLDGGAEPRGALSRDQMCRPRSPLTHNVREFAWDLSPSDARAAPRRP